MILVHGPLYPSREDCLVENSSALVTDVIDDIAVVRLNQPSQRNSLSLATLQELQNTLISLLANRQIKALIFTGTGNVFASGADLRELSQLDPASALKFARRGQSLFQTIADARPVTIAAINGYCMGGGLDLALACEIRVASTSAIFSHPGARRGIITGWGGTQRLPASVGRARAIELLITASEISSETALAMGLVTSVQDPVLTCAVSIACEVSLLQRKHGP